MKVFLCFILFIFASFCIFLETFSMDRETVSRSKLDIYHLKQLVQKIMHQFWELYQDFV